MVILAIVTNDRDDMSCSSRLRLGDHLRLISLQELRGVAALAVFVYHAQHYSLQICHPNANDPLAPLGWLGVQLFFVLSGFFMSQYALGQGGGNIFLMRRALRIYPAFLVSVLLAISLKVLVFGSITQPKLAMALTLLPLGQLPYPLFIEWSLVFEVTFYLFIWALIAVRMRRYIFPVMICWLAIILVLPSRTDLLETFPSILGSIWNVGFIMGAIAGWIKLRKPRVILPRFISHLWPLPFIYYLVNQNGFVNQKIEIVLVGCIFGVATLARDRHSKRFEARKSLLARVGNSSYGIYLIHVTLIAITLECIRELPVIAFACTYAVAIPLIFCISYAFGKAENYAHVKMQIQMSKKVLVRH